MSIIIDVAVAIIILIFVIIAYKKGFVASLLDFVGTVIAWFASVNLSNIVSGWIYETFLKNSVTEYITQKLSESASTATDSLLSSIPEFISNAAASMGIDLSAVLGAGAGQEIGDAVATINEGIFLYCEITFKTLQENQQNSACWLVK